MEKNTHLASSIENTVNKSRYDAEVKELLADKQVLARIMKYSVAEYKDCGIDEIIECIEGEPKVAEVNVFPGEPEKQKITGALTESNILGEGKITYDIRFFAVTPDKERIRLYLNVEAQKKYHVGYDLIPRGIFHCARMISEQMNTEIDSESYDQLKKVYSIWICMEAPKKAANTITEYSIGKKNIFGSYEGKEKYDLLSVVMVRLLGKEINPEKLNLNVMQEEGLEDQNEGKNDLIQMLTILLSHTLDAETKKKALEDNYNMKMTKRIEGGIRSMCNLSDLVVEWGMEKGMAQGIEKGMAQGIEKGMAQGMAQGLAVGENVARCNAIRTLCKKMSSHEIVSLMNYDEAFVESVIHFAKNFLDATDKEIVEMIKE